MLEVQKVSLAEAAKIGPKDNRDLDPQGVRRAILGAYARIQPDPKELVPVLVTALKSDRDGQVRNQAIGQLSQIGAVAKEAVPTLLEVHKSIPGPGDPQGVRRAIVAALGRMESDPKEVLPVYIRDPERGAHPGCAAGGRPGHRRPRPAGKPAFATLVDVMKTSTPQSRAPMIRRACGKAVVEALVKIESDPKEFVPVLITAVKQDRDPAVRTAAVAALGQLGSEAKAAVPMLNELIKSARTEPDKLLAKEATAVLEKIGK